MMPEGLNKFDTSNIHTYITVDGQDYEIHGFSKMPVFLGGNRAWRRSKERNPRDHAKFYRRDQIRPWNS